MGILGNASGGFGFPKSFVITDDSGNELTAVVTDEVKVFDATPSDVRMNKIFASENGIQTGENTITYITTAGYQIFAPNSNISINLSERNKYNYDLFQCMICLADLGNINNSVAAKMIAVNNGVYEVNSAIKIADISKNSESKSIDFNITNNSENYYLVYFFTYCQEE